MEKDKIKNDPKYAGVLELVRVALEDLLEEQKAKKEEESKNNDDTSENIFDSLFSFTKKKK